MRLTRLDNKTDRLDCRLDCIELSTEPMPVRTTSWGRLKHLFGRSTS